MPPMLAHLVGNVTFGDSGGHIWLSSLPRSTSAHSLGGTPKKKGPETIRALTDGGAGGNRTRVRKSSKDSSTYLVD